MYYDNLSSLKQQARNYRDKYEAGEEANLEQEQEMNPQTFGMIPGGYSGSINELRMRHGRERAAAMMNPNWDAWFQAVSNNTRGNPVIGGLRNQLK